MTTNYKIIVLEDQQLIREGITTRLQTSFENLTSRRPDLKQFVPTVAAYGNLEELFQGEVSQQDTFYSWITDWNLDDKKTGGKTSAAVYTSLAHLLGGYDLELGRGIDENPVLQDYTQLLEEVSPANREKLNRILLNSGAFVIYTGHATDVIFRSDVCLAFGQVGNVDAPLVLYQSKGDLTKDVTYISLGCLLAESAYEGCLPRIGKKTSSLEGSRKPLPELLAEKFRFASKGGGETKLTSFLKACSLEGVL
ncbi:MAG: hypothetical protein WCV90_07535 [Candidatus Woesearchaeota archaeon]|jgi:hypothetical protein